MMFRVTIVGRDLKEFQKNLMDFAKIHSSNASNVEVKKYVSESLVEEDLTVEEEMEEVTSPFSPAPAVVEETVEEEVVADTSVTDSEGLPWDARIHSSSKAFNKDGTWRVRRGLDKNVHDQVYSELKAKYGNKNFSVPSTVITQTPAIETPTVITEAAPAPVQPPMPTMQTGGHTFETFSANFHVILANLITEGKITQEYVNELKKFFGLDEIWKVNDEQKQMLFDQWVEYKFITKA